jgi:hypothetical protein
MVKALIKRSRHARSHDAELMAAVKVGGMQRP